MHRRPSRLPLIALAALGLVAALPTLAHASPPIPGPSEKKQVRIAADTELFGWANINPYEDEDEDVQPNTNVVGFGLNRHPLPDSFSGSGFPGYDYRPIINLSVGYVFLGNRAIVGARFGFGVEHVPDNEPDPDDETRVTFSNGMIAPYFRWVFLPGSIVRPYVDGRVGIVGAAGKAINEMTTPAGTTTTTVRADTIGPVFGLGGGVHIFPTNFFSVDLGLQYELRAPHSRSSTTVELPGGTTNTTEVARRQQAIINGLGILLGVSVWL